MRILIKENICWRKKNVAWRNPENPNQCKLLKRTEKYLRNSKGLVLYRSTVQFVLLDVMAFPHDERVASWRSHRRRCAPAFHRIVSSVVMFLNCDKTHRDSYARLDKYTRNIPHLTLARANCERAFAFARMQWVTVDRNCKSQIVAKYLITSFVRILADKRRLFFNAGKKIERADPQSLIYVVKISRSIIVNIIFAWLKIILRRPFDPTIASNFNRSHFAKAKYY